jgi:hypothetical protein
MQGSRVVGSMRRAPASTVATATSCTSSGHQGTFASAWVSVPITRLPEVVAVAAAAAAGATAAAVAVAVTVETGVMVAEVRANFPHTHCVRVCRSSHVC